MFDSLYCILYQINQLPGVVGNVLSGILLAVIFFFFKERVFCIPKIGGILYLKQITEETAYNPYKGMELQYMLSIRLEGNKVYGSAEKIYEDASIGKRRQHIIHYQGRFRTLSELEGIIEKKYLGRDRLIIHFFEENERRKSTTYYEALLRKKYLFFGEIVFEKGIFKSTIARQEGYFNIQSKRFDQKPQEYIPEFVKKGHRGFLRKKKIKKCE